jgi:putative membrane protein (TIGR04086 family)
MEWKKKMRGRDDRPGVVRVVGAALFVMFIVSGLLLLLLAAVLYKLEPGEAFIRIGVIMVYIISGVAGGLLMGKIQKEKKYLWGLAAGALYFAVLFVVSAAVKGGFDMEMGKVTTTMLLCAAAGMVGGMLA